jgi:hypothetical protein
LQRAAAVSGFRTAAHFQPDASPGSRSAVRFERLTVRIPSSQPAYVTNSTEFLHLRVQPEKGALPGALRAPAIAAVQERAASRRLSARQDRNISVGH